MLKQLKDIYTDILRCMRSTHAVFAKDGAEVSRFAVDAVGRDEEGEGLLWSVP